MPQFLEKRFDSRVRTGLAFFWVLLFIFVNITSVFVPGFTCFTDHHGHSIAVCYHRAGHLLRNLCSYWWSESGCTYRCRTSIGLDIRWFGSYLHGIGSCRRKCVLSGLATLVEKAPEKFDMILEKSNPEYMNLPGISVLVGGMWIANLYYWGTNQYIIQKSLASKSLDEAQTGTAVAAMIKVILPMIVVIPGIAAYVLGAEISKPDEAYPWVITNYVGSGFKGIAIAALIAAIGSSVAAIVNSASTIFTLDIYRPLFMTSDAERKQILTPLENNSSQLTVKEEHKLIRVGKISGLLFLLIGVLIAPSLGSLEQAFQYIQDRIY